MNSELVKIIYWQFALIGGAAVGLLFGKMQQMARRRYELLQQAGKLRSEWSVVGGSSRRIAVFLIILAVAQVLMPQLFKSGCQWWFSGGVLVGYGVTLFRQFQQRKAALS